MNKFACLKSEIALKRICLKENPVPDFFFSVGTDQTTELPKVNF